MGSGASVILATPEKPVLLTSMTVQVLLARMGQPVP